MLAGTTDNSTDSEPPRPRLGPESLAELRPLADSARRAPCSSHCSQGALCRARRAVHRVKSSTVVHPASPRPMALSCTGGESEVEARAPCAAKQPASRPRRRSHARERGGADRLPRTVSALGRDPRASGHAVTPWQRSRPACVRTSGQFRGDHCMSGGTRMSRASGIPDAHPGPRPVDPRVGTEYEARPQPDYCCGTGLLTLDRHAR